MKLHVKNEKNLTYQFFIKLTKPDTAHISARTKLFSEILVLWEIST